MNHGQRSNRRETSTGSRGHEEPQADALREMPPFSGQLVDGKQAYNWLIDALPRVERPVSLCSAFLRSEALLALFPNSTGLEKGRILVRWQLGDLQAGASDLQGYSVAKDLGFKLFVRQDFHGKVFSLPGIGVVVGSANATSAGFGLKASSNAEVCTLVPSLDSNLSLIDDLFESAVQVDDSLFEEISEALMQAPANGAEFGQWPKELMQKLQPPLPVNWLLVSECLSFLPSRNGSGLWNVSKEEDRHLLGLRDVPISTDCLTVAFTSLKLYHWLVETLRRSVGELYFGSLSVELHNSLLDDPGICRRDVKDLLQVLLAWCEFLPDCRVVIDRPKHSQRIRLKLTKPL
ncbi:MAG: hypothetical protein KJ852_01215 [Gammaproteobacteria bacterium]|nr:hypothetical protein [Gammaproteobacteria bacterium]MBU0788172.1 hypothetical protein [Gammaproteobacteria bacterium]MBU0815331.1 hypothetical protein [Gammaproteobacteria bacterium]MBU1785561.1 hypothetical protein [Gammaproteobacteria bacterium]